MEKIKVLVLEADGVQSLSIAESLHKHGIIVHGFFGKKLSYGYACRYYTKRIMVNLISRVDYISQIVDYVEKEQIDVIFPMGDFSANLVSKYQERLKGIVHMVTPEYESFCEGYDKNRLMRCCHKLNVPHPRTIDLSTCSIYKDVDESFFPALLKPNITTGGRGMKFLKSKKELEKWYGSIHKEYGDCHLQEFIESGGKQLKVQLFVDETGNLLCSSVMHKQRYYPESGGSSCCNTTVDNEAVVENCHKVLKAIKWKGLADFDLIEDPKDGEFKIMEINPRVPACIKSAIKSGADYAELYVDYAIGRRPPKYYSKPGYTLRYLGFEFLWFLQSKNRFKTSPSWFNFWGRHIYYQDFSLKDPLTFVYGSVDNIIKLLDPSFRKSKSRTR